MTIARDFVDWAWTIEPAAVPEPVRRRVALHVLDGIGTGLAAARLDNAPFAVPTARSLGSGNESTVLGSATRAPACGAALANGILIHSLDFDDTHTAGLVHATAMTLPAGLAVAERERSTGAQFLRAMTIGYELAGRLGRAAPHGFHRKGVHATSVCGTFTAAIVTALLSRLPADQAVNALGIAGSQSSGSMEFLATGASTKQVHPGWASLAGVVAAELAAHGATGPESIIEGGHGLYALFASGAAPGSVVTGLGETWQVCGAEIKPYPACHLIHRSLDVARILGASTRPEEVQEVVVRVPEDSIPIVAEPATVKQRPRTAYEAKFSVQWSIAAMLVDGEVGVGTYDPDRLDRSDVLAVSERVRYEPVFDDRAAAEQPGDVTVTLDGGTTTRLRSDSPGFPAPGDVEETVLAKFRSNTGSSRVAEALIDAVLSLEQAPDLGALTESLRAAAALGRATHSVEYAS